MHVPTLCDWLSSCGSVCNSDDVAFIDCFHFDCKRQSHKRNQSAVFTRLSSLTFLIMSLTPPLVKTSLYIQKDWLTPITLFLH